MTAPLTASIPAPALWLGVAGLLPFGLAAALETRPGLVADLPGVALIAPSGDGVALALAYGTAILCFMSGALWGFAAGGRGWRAALGYALSTLPALYAVFWIEGAGRPALMLLAAGFGALLLLDALFWQQGLAPRWWLSLRLWLTAGVLVCLGVTIYG